MTARSSPRWKKTKWRGHDNYVCLRCAYRVLGDRGAMVRHADTHHPLPSQDPEAAAAAANPLRGIDFTERAGELAVELLEADRLDLEALRSTTPTGKTGFTVDDVRAHMITTAEEE